ncbi:MAG: hypothetical protein DRP03_01155 [Candidatus Aenigmatarchaeota archaeon]|nr:MAG: hypothetical protein DRP03_01155 [Candidatus Aenigmarchaeota archaeon]
MKPSTLLRTGRVCGYILLLFILLYLITGFSITGKFGFHKIINKNLALLIHLNMEIPFLIVLILHVFPHLYLRYIKKR